MLYATLSVRENLRFRAAVFGLSDPARAADLQISAAGLTEFAATPLGQLSGGWSKQVELAAAMIHRPRLLLLDEPTAGLDPAARHAIWRTLTALAVRGTAIVLSTHDLVEARRCSHVLLLSNGRIRASGSPEALTRQVAASAIMVSGRDVLDLAELLQTSLVIAADPVGRDIRLLVAAEALDEVETLLANRGYTSTPASPTLEDAALVVARRPHPFT
jgi:ABC-2 type transport system ATP-binding protein